MAALRSILCLAILPTASVSPGVGQVLAGPRGPVESTELERWSAPELPESWQALKSVVEEDFGLLFVAARMFGSRHDTESVRERAELVGTDPAALEPIWALIEGLGGEQDRRLAHEVLAGDTSWSLRATAAAILVNFSEHDAAWHVLMSTMIDPEQRVRGIAEAVLRGFIGSGKARPVRWDGAWDPLVALFDGTNPSAFPTVLRVLAATEISQELGGPLIHGAPNLLRAYLGAEQEGTRECAVSFLRTLSGEDFGTDPEEWLEWLNRRPRWSVDREED